MVRIQTPQMWAQGYTGKGVKVAVVDSGIALDHDDLNVSGGVSFIPYTSSYADDHDHGTHIAGVIGSGNRSGEGSGVAPDAELYAVKVIDYNNRFFTSELIKGIEWTITHDIDIVNLSLSLDNYYDHYALHEILKIAYERIYCL